MFISLIYDNSFQTYLLVNKISHYFTLYVTVAMLLGILLFNALPLYNNITAGAFRRERPANLTFEHSVYMSLPFDSTTNFKGFLVQFTFNWYISYICSACFCIVDLFLSLMVFHVWGHLRILIQKMETFTKPNSDENGKDSGLYSEEEMKEVGDKLKEIVQHHTFVLEYV
jgi:hypothetical protein